MFLYYLWSFLWQTNKIAYENYANKSKMRNPDELFTSGTIATVENAGLFQSSRHFFFLKYYFTSNFSYLTALTQRIQKAGMNGGCFFSAGNL